MENLPPADELFAVRSQLKVLKEREEVLRQLMLSDPSARTGNNFVAEIAEVSTSRTDIKAMREMYPNEVAEHTYPARTTRVELKAISEDGEILPIRRRA